MRFRTLALATMLALAPAAAPAITLQYNLDGAGFQTFPTGTLVPVSLGNHEIQIRIAPGAGESISGYLLNFEGTAGGAEASPFLDPFDSDGDGTPDTNVNVTCKAGRAGADTNCGAAFVFGGGTAGSVNLGLAEVLASNLSVNLLAVNRIVLSASQVGATFKLLDSSSVTDGNLVEISVGGLGFSVIPEPGTALLIGAGLAGLGLARRRSR